MYSIKGINKYIDFPLKFQIFALCILISLWGIHGRSISVCTLFRDLYLFNVQKRRVQYLLGDTMYDDDLSCRGASVWGSMLVWYGMHTFTYGVIEIAK